MPTAPGDAVGDSPIGDRQFGVGVFQLSGFSFGPGCKKLHHAFSDPQASKHPPVEQDGIGNNIFVVSAQRFARHVFVIAKECRDVP